MFAKPVADLITLEEQRKISTPIGVFCSIVFAAFGIAAFGFLIMGLTGSDNYYNQSAAWQNRILSKEQPISLDQVIIAYDTSLSEEYMLGAFLQGSALSVYDKPVPMKKCDELYANNANIRELINSPTAMCMDFNEDLTITFG